MKRLVFALLLALPIVAVTTWAYAECGSAHGTASPDKVATPAPPPPPPTEPG